MPVLKRFFRNLIVLERDEGFFEMISNFLWILARFSHVSFNFHLNFAVFLRFSTDFCPELA
jgi:hypothetical protein